MAFVIRSQMSVPRVIRDVSTLRILSRRVCGVGEREPPASS